MRNKDEQAGPVIEADKDQFLKESANFERDRERDRERSRSVAWRIAIVSSCMTVAFGIAMTTLVVKFEPVAFLVFIDKTTGESSVMKRLDKDTVAFSEMHDKSNLKRYVMARESYNYTFLQRDYDLTMDMSCEKEGQEYAKQFDGDKGLDKVLGAGTEYRINVVSVRPLPNQPGQAVVTFDKTIKVFATNEVRAPQRYTATLEYLYRPDLKKRESVWIENPTGFKVCGYRADPELGANK